MSNMTGSPTQKDILLVGDERTENIFRSCDQKYIGMFFPLILSILEWMKRSFLREGKYLTKNGFKKKSELMMAHLSMVLKLCRKYHLRPQMWSDMFVHMLDNGDNSFTIPEELQIVYWDYYSTEEKRYHDNFEKQLPISRRLGFLKWCMEMDKDLFLTMPIVFWLVGHL